MPPNPATPKPATIAAIQANPAAFSIRPPCFFPASCHRSNRARRWPRAPKSTCRDNATVHRFRPVLPAATPGQYDSHGDSPRAQNQCERLQGWPGPTTPPPNRQCKNRTHHRDEPKPAGRQGHARLVVAAPASWIVRCPQHIVFRHGIPGPPGDRRKEHGTGHPAQGRRLLAWSRYQAKDRQNDKWPASRNPPAIENPAARAAAVAIAQTPPPFPFAAMANARIPPNTTKYTWD